MSLDRPLELAERAMKFIQTFSLLLQQRQEQGHIVPRLREASAPCLPAFLPTLTMHCAALGARSHLEPGRSIPPGAV